MADADRPAKLQEPSQHSRYAAQELDGRGPFFAQSDGDLAHVAARPLGANHQLAGEQVAFDHDYAAARTRIIDYLERHDVVVAGRYGKWEYSSMEDAILSGREAARALEA